MKQYFAIVVLLLVLCNVRIIDGKRPNECEDPYISGSCRGYFPSYYFDREQSRCFEFIYGGCGGMLTISDQSLELFHSILGNGNRFSTETECMQHCSESTD